MKKNKLIALVIIAIAFFTAFPIGFMEMSTDNPFLTLIGFVVVVVGTLLAIFIGNNEPAKNEENS